MLQHADSRLLNAYQFGTKSALAAVNLSQLLSSGTGIKDSSHQQQLNSSLAQSPLNSEGSTSATPPFHLAETNLPDEICVQSSLWSEFLNGASSSNSFMGDNLDNTIPTSSASATNSSWWSSRDQEQWNQVATTTANQATPANVSMSELEGGDWSPGQLGCLPTPEVNEQLTNMTLEQNEVYSNMTTALVDPEISTAPTSWSSILMGSSGNEEQALEAGAAEGLQEALFSKSFMNRTSTDMLAPPEAGVMKKAAETWEFNPLKGSAAFEMDEMSKQQFTDERLVPVGVDSWSTMMNSRGVAATGTSAGNFSLDAAFGGSQFVGTSKIKQEIESQFYNSVDSSFSKPNNNMTMQMLAAGGEVPSRWGAQSSRLPAMLSHVLPANCNSATSSKAANLFGTGMVMSRSFGNYTPKAEPYKAQREQSSMSQHSSITSQHSYDSKDSHASKHMMEESREVSSSDPSKRGLSSDQHASEPFFKRPRIEQQQQQPASAPTLPFKATTFVLQVRKEKLGERITALQQLVSPFGKTDTASVLLEAIGYIKFLHEQVQVLSTPYMKNPSAAAPSRSNETVAMKGSSSWSSEASKSKEGDEPRQDLRSRGLCLVPISSTLQVANDNGADFWTPNIGGSGK